MKFTIVSTATFFYAASLAAALPGLPLGGVVGGVLGGVGGVTPPTGGGGGTTTPPTGGGGGSTTPGGNCNTGPVQCCNTVQKASAPSSAALLGLLGIVLQDLDVLVGITCSPLSVIGIGSGGCNTQPVCCQNNTFNGLISLGCVPIIINA